MNEPLSYLSIRTAGSAEYKEKGSKFLGHALHVTNIEQAKEEIDNLRSLHPKSVHVCFAWKIGISKFEERYSDDGEPNNSAGKPIFGQILAADLTNVLIAVVRYYGGTKLGVGGLVSAYKTAAKAAIQDAEVISKTESEQADIIFSPNHTSSLMALLNQLGADIEAHGFEGQLHKVQINFPKAKTKEFIDIFENHNTFEFRLLP